MREEVVICECCEREQPPSHAGWIVDRDGTDLCPECVESFRAAAQESIDKLPLRIGLCPEHAPEFYYPLKDGESLTCPQCLLDMVVYERAAARTPTGERT